MTLPLGGARVLDVSNVLAGSFCGCYLARLGAELIQVENPKAGDLARRRGGSGDGRATDGPVLRRRARPIRVAARTKLLAAIAKGRRWLAELTSGAVADIEAITARENLS